MLHFGLGRNVQSFSSSLTYLAKNVQYLSLGSELLLISSDATATRVLSAVPERIFSRPFSEQSSELPFQNFDGL